MTDETAPHRRIEGVSALSRMRSTPTVTPPTRAVEPAPEPERPALPDASTEVPGGVAEREVDPQGARARLSGYTTNEFARLAKGTYKATAHLEDEASFSDFLQAAVDREITRRQQLYNDGRPFAVSTSRLQAGRPLRS